MKEFYTRERANKGIQLPLPYPDGSPSGHSLQIRSTDSDAFRAAEAKHRQQVLEIDGADKELEAKLVSEARMHLLASLIISWTFEEELTAESAVEFMREAPQVADLVDQKAAQRALFYPPASPSSDATHGHSSSSTSQPQAAASPGVSTSGE